MEFGSVAKTFPFLISVNFKLCVDAKVISLSDHALQPEIRMTKFDAVLAAIAAAFAVSVHAQQPIAYPAKGQSQAQQDQAQGQMTSWNRAYAACMEGRGYTIK
jgi:hypothetical protein